jgi:hypothetical protein
MFLLFVVLPLAVLLGADVGAVQWWARRRRLMNGGVPVTGEVVRVNITDYVDRNTRRVTSTTMRPVVRFTTQTGEAITTSPMRSGLDELLIPGEPVKIRYSAGNPMQCVVDQRGASRGTTLVLAVLVVVNIFMIGFASIGSQIVGSLPSIPQGHSQPPSIPQGHSQPPSIPQGLTQGTGQPTESGAGSSTTTPAAPAAAATAGAWNSGNGPLTVTIVKVVNAGGKVTLTVSAQDSAPESVTLPIFGNFTATDDQGTAYTANPLTPITVPANGTVSGTLTLDQTVPASARNLSIKWSNVFSLDHSMTGSMTITGVPLPQ